MHAVVSATVIGVVEPQDIVKTSEKAMGTSNWNSREKLAVPQRVEGTFHK
jgi:hypothetical protein